MSERSLPPEQRAEAERIYQAVKGRIDAELHQLAELLASKADREIFGATEFEVRQRVHRIGAEAIQAALEERKKGVPRFQRLLSPLPRSGQIPALASENLAERREGSAGGARLLLLQALSAGPLSLG